MIGHIFKIVWSGKRSNILLILEILFTFCFLAAMVTIGLTYWNRYRQPVGFSHENVIDIHFRDLQISGFRSWAANVGKKQAEMIEAARGFEEVEAAGFSWESLYDGLISGDSVGHNGEKVETMAMMVTEGVMDVLKLEMIQGHPFGSPEIAGIKRPLIITKRMRDLLFEEEENPIGKTIRYSGGPVSTLEHGYDVVVVGVLLDFKRNGELSKSPYIVLRPAIHANYTQPRCSQCWPLRHLFIRVRPGVEAERRAEMIAKLQEIAGLWALDVSTLEEQRIWKLRDYLEELIALGIIGLLLLAMVCLGLMGIVWQNVVRRTREIGLRRAHGATRGHISRQIVGEQLLLTTIGVLPGVLLIAQAPFLNIVESVDAGFLAIGIAFSAIAMYVIALISSWPPSAIAARIHPAEALHHE